MTASKPQTWALFCATGLDCRNCGLTYDQASEFITRSRAGEDITSELVALGASGKSKQPKHNWETLYDKAHNAGMTAGESVTPNAMVVTNGVQNYYVSEGLCGFAWVVVTPGNSSFAIWAKKNRGARKEYSGGVCAKWVSEFNQSYERKVAYAQAFAAVLREAGIKAYAADRLD